MKLDGNNWVNVGNPGFSAGFASNTSIAFSPIGEPYVAFRDDAQEGKAMVVKYNGSYWVTVGRAPSCFPRWRYRLLGASGKIHYVLTSLATSEFPSLY
jgi:hypothetical protein